jgi:nucleotide-binding universal stress UspA family protein
MTTAAGFELGCDGPRTFVVGVDGSDTSWRALYYALGLARRQRTTIVAVFAATIPIAVGGDGTVADVVAHAHAQLVDELKPAIQALAADYGVLTEFIARTGDPVNLLVQVATERRADALIVGASQARLHQILGSKAVRAVRRCPCPVTVVP